MSELYIGTLASLHAERRLSVSTMHIHYANTETEIKIRRQVIILNTTAFTRARILVQVTIYRRLLIGRDGHLDQSEAYDIS